MTAFAQTPRAPLTTRQSLPLAQPSPPPFPLVAAHFGLGFLWAIAGALALVALAPTLAAGAFLDPRLLAATHFLTLGWITTVITGVLYQIFPAMLGISARSLRIARWSLAAQTAGTAALAAGLGWGQPPLQVAGWVLISAAVYGVAWNFLPQRRRAPRNRQLGIFVSYAHMGLGFALALGGARIGDALGWWTTPRLPLIAAHFHFAVVGFATMTSFGVGSRMLPMFLGSLDAPALSLRWLPRVLATGTVLFAIGIIGGLDVLTWSGAGGMVAGTGVFLWLGFRWVRTRARPALDPAAAFLLGALLWLLLAVPLGVDALIRGLARPGILTSYAALLLLGWLTGLILGVSFRVLPNLTWHHRFAARAGRPGTPPLSTLLLPPLGWAAFAGHGLGMLALIGGLHRGEALLVRTGMVLLSTALVLAAGHHLRMLVVGKTRAAERPDR